MSVAVAEEPRVLHTVPGRVRVHVPGWSGQGKRSIETRLREVQGVRSAQVVSPKTNLHPLLWYVKSMAGQSGHV